MLYAILYDISRLRDTPNDNIDRMASASEKENTVAFYLIPILGIFLLVAVVLLVVCLFKRFNPKLFN